MRLWMQFGNFGIKGLMLNPSSPSPSPGLCLKRLFPALLIHGQHWDSPAVSSSSLGLLPDGFGVGAQRGSSSCGIPVPGIPMDCTEKPQCVPRTWECSVVPPASSFPTSSGEIAGNGKHLSEGRFQDGKRRIERELCLGMLLQALRFVFSGLRNKPEEAYGRWLPIHFP